MNQPVSQTYNFDNARKRPVYAPAFREEAIRLSQQIGRGAAARTLGISENTLANWINKAKKKDLPTTDTIASSVILAENLELKKEIKILKETIALLLK